MKYHNLKVRKVRKVRRTLEPNLEPPEPFDCPPKPNLEPTEPPKMAEPRTSNKVRSKSRHNHSWHCGYITLIHFLTKKVYSI